VTSRSRRIVVVSLGLVSLVLTAGLCRTAAADTSPTADQAVSAPTVVADLVSQQTATSDTYLLSDGSLRTEIVSQPMRFQDAGGNWQSFDTTLVPSGLPGTYRSLQTPGAVTLGPGTLPFPAQMAALGYTVGLGLVGGNGVQTTVLGDSATYLAATTATNVTYRALDTGLEQSLILGSATAPTSFKCMCPVSRILETQDLK